VTPNLSIHTIKQLVITPLVHHPAIGNLQEFWSRRLEFWGTDGELYEIPIYSNVSAEALEPAPESKGTECE
jgi:hypothetical protein